MTESSRLRFVHLLALLCVGLSLLVIAGSSYVRLHKQIDAFDTWIALARLLHRVAASVMLVAVLLVVAAAKRAAGWQARETRVAIALAAIVIGLTLLGPFSAGRSHAALVLANMLGGYAILALSAALAFGPLRRATSIDALLAGLVTVALIVLGALLPQTLGWLHALASALLVLVLVRLLRSSV